MNAIKSSEKQAGSTCSNDNADSKADKSETGSQEQPPEKKPRLSNREYKKLTKGQNKVSN